jgi:hypothetical protein
MISVIVFLAMRFRFFVTKSDAPEKTSTKGTDESLGFQAIA